MKNVHNWLKYGASASFTLLLICCAALVLQVLAKENNMTAGIAIFRFNFTHLTLLGHPVRGASQERNIVQSLQGIESAAAAAATTIIHGAISQVQSAASTAIPSSVEALIPRNCSLGIKEFCVGSAYNCSKLPLNLPSIIPTEVANFFQLDFNDIEPLNTALAKITTPYIYDCLLLGLLLTIGMAVLSAYSIFCLSSKLLKAGIHLTTGLICFILFIIPVAILSILDAKAEQLPSWIQVEHGRINTPILVSLVFVGFVATLGTITSIVL